MTFLIADRVRESSVTTGTGNITLGGAVVGYQTFDAVLNTGDTTFYVFADQAGGPNWEVGIGTFTAPSTLARTTILSSSNSGNIVNFGAGTKDVFISLPASKTNVEDQPNIIEVNSSSAALRITQTGSGNALVVEDSANPDATPFVVDASGVVIVGNTSTQGTVPLGNGGRYTPQTQIQGSAFGTSGLSVTLFNAAAPAGGGSLALNKSNTNTLGSQAVVANGDVLGTVFFNGSDGTNFVRGAQIQAAVDGTPGTNDMPGRLVFSTTADGASSPTERMRIDASGNVGIGTSSPGNRLDIVGVSTSQIRVKDGVNATAYYDFGRDGTDGFFGFSGAQTVFSGYKWSINAGTEVMRITNAGNVGIGTAFAMAARLVVISPPNSPSLLLSDATQSTLTIRHEAGNLLTYEVGGTAVQRWVGNSFERMRIDASGNVGIGTSSPNKSGSNVALTVNAASGQYGAIELSTGDVGRWYINADATNVYDTAMNNTNRTFYTGGSERMRIDASGNVGIGTSSPGVRFHVNSGAADEVARFEGTGSPFITLFDTNVRQFYLNAVANSVDMVVEPSKALTFGTNGSERMRIDASGNVGIGTSSPQNRLQVNGSFGRGAPVTKTGSFTLADTENWIICNGTGSITVTFPAASSWTGREVMIKTIAAQTVVSASSDVVPLAGGAAGTAILSATAGAWATLVSDGTNWIIMQA